MSNISPRQGGNRAVRGKGIAGRFLAELHDRIGGRLLLATAVVSAITALVKCASVSKDLLVASQFGRSDPFEAFVNAFVIPSLISGVFASAINAALIATYVATQTHAGR